MNTAAPITAPTDLLGWLHAEAAALHAASGMGFQAAARQVIDTYIIACGGDPDSGPLATRLYLAVTANPAV